MVDPSGFEPVSTPNNKIFTPSCIVFSKRTNNTLLHYFHYVTNDIIPFLGLVPKTSGLPLSNRVMTLPGIEPGYPY